MILAPCAFKQTEARDECLHNGTVDGIVAIAGRLDVGFSPLQVVQDVFCHLVAWCACAVQSRVVVGKYTVYPWNVAELRHHQEILVRAEEQSHAAPVVLVGFIHLRSGNAIEHQIDSTDVAVVPVRRLRLGLHLAVSPLVFVARGTFEHIVRLVVALEYGIGLTRSIRISKEHVVQTPRVCLEIVVRRED